MNPAVRIKASRWSVPTALYFDGSHRHRADVVDAPLQRQESEPTEATGPASPPVNEPARKPVTLKVGRETAGRRGKGVTTVSDVPLDEAGLLELATKLKDRCGTGGTVKDGVIEIQGDQRDRLAAVLEGMGYKAKRVGG